MRNLIIYKTHLMPGNTMIFLSEIGKRSAISCVQFDIVDDKLENSIMYHAYLVDKKTSETKRYTNFTVRDTTIFILTGEDLPTVYLQLKTKGFVNVTKSCKKKIEDKVEEDYLEGNI